jgi:hypothetical protein
MKIRRVQVVLQLDGNFLSSTFLKPVEAMGLADYLEEKGFRYHHEISDGTLANCKGGYGLIGTNYLRTIFGLEAPVTNLELRRFLGKE